jgi:hypothetical protein
VCGCICVCLVGGYLFWGGGWIYTHTYIHTHRCVVCVWMGGWVGGWVWVCHECSDSRRRHGTAPHKPDRNMASTTNQPTNQPINQQKQPLCSHSMPPHHKQPRDLNNQPTNKQTNKNSPCILTRAGCGSGWDRLTKVRRAGEKGGGW